MPIARDEGELRSESDIAYQMRTWRVQRIGWIAFAALIAAALSGLFGSGPLARATAGSDREGFAVEYERLARRDAPAALVLRIDRGLARDAELRIVLAGDLVRRIELQSTLPPVAGTSVGPDGIVLRFRVEREPGVLAIALHTRPRGFGPLSSRIGVADGPAYAIRQWIYP